MRDGGGHRRKLVQLALAQLGAGVDYALALTSEVPSAALLEHRACRFDARDGRVEWGGSVGCGRNRGHDKFVQLGSSREEDLPLVREVAEEGPFCEPSALGYLCDGRVVEPALAVELHRRLFQAAASVRLTPTVHGEGDPGFVPIIIGVAREKGVSGFLGDGSSRWPAVHRVDAARLFRLALEKAPAGAVLHGVAEEGIPTREIADVIGQHLGVPVESISPGGAVEHFGFLGAIFGLDSPASSVLTRERYAWQPQQPGLIDDLKQGHYFENV